MVVGLCYYYGLGLEQDVQKAIEWYTHGAQGGNKDCMCELAKIYHFGILAPKDTQKARGYMVRAANAGSDSAVLMLAWAYFIGEGVEKDDARAYKLYLRAARRENAEACYWVGLCHRRGYGVQKDSAAAAQWWFTGAMRGDLNCCIAMGELNARGEGVPRNTAASRFWLGQAATQGVYLAAEILRRIERAQEVSPVSVEKISQLTAEQCLEQYLYCIYVADSAESPAAEFLERAVELGSYKAAAIFASEKMAERAHPQLYLPALQQAADAEEPTALAEMVHYHNMGCGGKVDILQAVEYMQRYAEAGKGSDAQFSVADACALGFKGGRPDAVQMEVWCRKAAEQGHKIAARVLPFAEILSRSVLESENK